MATKWKKSLSLRHLRLPPRYPSGEPGFEDQDGQRGHDEPTPQFLALFQFGCLQAQTLLFFAFYVFRRRDQQRQPETFQFFQRQRRRAALRRIAIYGETDDVRAHIYAVNPGQIGAGKPVPRRNFGFSTVGLPNDKRL